MKKGTLLCRLRITLRNWWWGFSYRFDQNLMTYNKYINSAECQAALERAAAAGHRIRLPRLDPFHHHRRIRNLPAIIALHQKFTDFRLVTMPDRRRRKFVWVEMVPTS